MGAKPDVIVVGQKPDGNYVPLKTNSNGELIVAGSIGGGSSALQITDGVNNATITDVAGKKALDVNVADIQIDHSNDSVKIGDGTRFADISPVNGKNALHVTEAKQEFITLIDEPDENTIYIGKASPGASGASAVWQIKRITFSGAITQNLFAGGVTTFSQVWNNRTSLLYS